MTLGFSKLAGRAILPAIILIAAAVYFFLGSSAGARYIRARATLARLLEPLICNQQVVGSNPTGGSKKATKSSVPLTLVPRGSDAELTEARFWEIIRAHGNSN